MMLLGDFYTLGAAGVENAGAGVAADVAAGAGPAKQTIRVVLDINVGHRIFEGHFPGHPVVPGVCMMQMIKEILETVTGKETRLVRADHAKFLSMINPLETASVQAELIYAENDEGEIVLEARLFKEGTIFFKYKATFADALVSGTESAH